MRASRIMQERVMKSPKIEMYFNSETDEILGESVVTGVRIKNATTGVTKEIPIDGFFVAIGHKPNSDIFKDCVEVDDQGYIITTPGHDNKCQRGIWVWRRSR